MILLTSTRSEKDLVDMIDDVKESFEEGVSPQEFYNS